MQNDVPPGDTRQPMLERRLATIMIADVAGYSRMMGENEEQTVQTLRGHREVFDALLELHRGRIFNTAGDAILAEFPSAVEAVRCATEIQSALRTRNEHLPEEQRMWFRIGVNLGDVIVQGDDLLGDGINVAARIQTVAEPGGVCISGSVYDQIQNKLSLQFKQLGERVFKNIAQPIRTFSIIEASEEEPASVAVPAPPPWRKIAGIAAAVVLLVVMVASGYWLYRGEQTRRGDELRQGAERVGEAGRTPLPTETQERKAQAEAEVQAAKAALERAEADKQRLAQELRRAEAEKRALPSPPPEKAADQAVPNAGDGRGLGSTAPAIPAPREGRGDARFDGTYDGQLCNERPAKLPGMRCVPVVLMVDGGKMRATWKHTATGKAATVWGTIATDGTIRVSLDGWVPSGKPMDGTMTGKWEKNVITLSGKWKNGLTVSGTWKKSS